MDYAYKGDQWFSVNEIPCIPWISQEVWNIHIRARTHAHASPPPHYLFNYI